MGEKLERERLALEESRRKAEEDLEERRVALEQKRAAALEAQRATRNRLADEEELMENQTLQEDELIALEAIFGECFERGEEAGVCTMRLGHSLDGICSVELTLPRTYPSLCPPTASFCNLPLDCDESALQEDLEAVFVQRVGEVMLY